jgi:hypothetical protein
VSRKYWNLILLLVPISAFVIGIYFSQQESGVCKQFRPYYYQNINGKVVRSYYCYLHGRKVGCIEIVNQKNDTLMFAWFHGKVFESIEPGDSVVKEKNKTMFDFYRGEKYIGRKDFECGPPNPI